MKKNRIKKSRSQLERELEEQLMILNDACNNFDEGKRHYAKIIATILRILLHEQGQSKSLLGQLALRNYFIDSAHNFNNNNLLTYSGLVAQRVQMTPNGAVSSYVAILDSNPNAKKITFSDWWNKPVIRDKDKRFFSRRELVKHVADTDGGAHVDPELEEGFHNLSRENSLNRIFLNTDCTSKPFDERPELPCIRQIAFEVLKTIEKVFP